jgi:hypothetical protein
MATPSVWPKARRKEKMVEAYAASLLWAAACVVMAIAGKSMPVPMPPTRFRKIHATVLVSALR